MDVARSYGCRGSLVFHMRRVEFAVLGELQATSRAYRTPKRAVVESH